MSEIMRINVDNSAERWESKDGIYVFYSDHLAETKRLREALEAEVESEKASKAFTDFLADSGKGKTTKEVMDEFERLHDACHEKRREYFAKREAALASAEQQNTNKG